MQIQGKILEAQKLNQMCIHKEELTELDIHNRILRYKNYMIGLVHKSILPLQHNVPFLGEVGLCSFAGFYEHFSDNFLLRRPQVQY